ncbi:hypothetical protein D3C83_144310 [compost metagenome]
MKYHVVFAAEQLVVGVLDGNIVFAIDHEDACGRGIVFAINKFFDDSSAIFFFNSPDEEVRINFLIEESTANL